MTITSLDIDDSTLQSVLKLSGVRTKTEAVNLALTEYVQKHERIAAIEHFSNLAQSWDYESWMSEHDKD